MSDGTRESQWMFNLLVHGFDVQTGVDAPGPHTGRVRTFRRDRLKEVVLRNLFDDYSGPCPRTMTGDSRYV